MSNGTYIALANTTLSSNTATVTFSSIPATYRDLVLVINGSAAQRSYFGIRFNSDTGNNYSNVRAQSENNIAGSDTSGTDWIAGYVIDTTQSVSLFNIMDYSATDKHKTVLSRSNSANYYAGMHTGRWANTNAVTSISAIIESSRNWNSGTTFALYGIVS